MKIVEHLKKYLEHDPVEVMSPRFVKDIIAEIEQLNAKSDHYDAMIEELQKIGEEFGAIAGERRTLGLRRILTDQQNAINRLQRTNLQLLRERNEARSLCNAYRAEAVEVIEPFLEAAHITVTKTHFDKAKEFVAENAPKKNI